MPPKKITISAGQGSMDTFFKQSSNTKILAVIPSHLNPPSPMATPPTGLRLGASSSSRRLEEPTQTASKDTCVIPSDTNPQITAFMASLTPNERIAHTIAKEKLGTSYDIQRTHGFVRWLAKSKTT